MVPKRKPQHFVLNNLGRNPREENFQAFGLIGIGPFEVKSGRMGREQSFEKFI